MAKKEGVGHGLLDPEPRLGSLQDGRDFLMSRVGKDTKDKPGISADDRAGSISGADGDGPVTLLPELLSEAESCKDRGNVEFYKGKVLAKHTAGKNLLRDACILYAEGLQALSKADARLAAERLVLAQETPPDKDQPTDESDVTDSADVESTLSEERLSEPKNAPPVSAASPAAAAAAATRSTRLSLLASLSGRADGVRPSLYLNLAACNLLLQEWTPAIACCTHVLDECCGDALREIETETARDQGGMGAGVGYVGSRIDGPSATRSASETKESAPAPAVTPTTTEKAAAAGSDHPTAPATAADVAAPVSVARTKQQEDKGESCGKNTSKSVLSSGEGVASGANLGPYQTEEEAAARRSKRREIAAKSLYRRAAAQVGGGDFAAAREDLVRALRLKPRDVAIGRELRKVEKKLAEDLAKESLRRETEEGRRRRQQQHHEQQQQQQQQHQYAPPAADKAAGASSVEGAQQLASSSAPRADHAIVAGGSHDVSSGTGGSAAAPNEQTSGGERRGLRKPQEEEEERKSGRCEGCEEEFPTENGGVCRDDLYAWNQSVREVQVCVRIPEWARASDLQVDIRRKRLSVSVVRRTTQDDGDDGNNNKARTRTDPAVPDTATGAGADAVVVLAGELSRPVQVDECLWTMEDEWPGRVLLYLHKELPPATGDGREEEAGFEWWASVMQGDPEIDVSKCDAGSDASKYPEHVRRRGAKALWEHQKKTPEEKLKEERMREARRQMEEEAEERQRDLDNALKDPKKAELYRQLRETMPDTSISIK